MALAQDIIPVDVAGTLDGLFRERVRRSRDAVAYIQYDKAAERWREYTWTDMAQGVERLRTALSYEGLRPGDRVGLLIRNGTEWVSFEQAALSLGLVVVSLYTDDRPDNTAYMLGNCAAKLLFVQDATQWRRQMDALLPLATLTRVLIGSGWKTDAANERVLDMASWLAQAADLPVTPPHHNEPRQLAYIVYTSGTTGRPKGVMLSHHNILTSAAGGLNVVPDVYPGDVFLSLLPVSHTYERSIGYYSPMMAGATLAYCRAIPQLAEDMLAIRPMMMVCVPRVLERIYMKIHGQLKKRSRLARGLFNLTERVGWRRFEAAQGRARGSPVLWLWPVLDRMVACKFRARLGGRLRWLACGGAPLPLPVARLFFGMGLPIYQGYGLTEASPLISANLSADNDPASVGTPIPGMEVRIGENAELLARGPGVMLGYWNDHTATYQMIDSEGWLHTGDQARIQNNHIYITGRLKDILVLSNGEKVPPADMEDAITLDPLFEQAMITGEGQAWLGTLLVINAEQWAMLAKQLKLDPFDKQVLKDSRVHAAVLARIAEQLQGFPSYAKVRRVCLLTESWTVENGLLTPTMKIKRNQVMAVYAKQIEDMFRGSRSSAKD